MRKWEWKQITPADYVGETVKTHACFNANFGYGYQGGWAIPLDGYYYAARTRGQRIYIMEKHDLVVDYGGFSGTCPIESKMPKMARYAISACKQ